MTLYEIEILLSIYCFENWRFKTSAESGTTLWNSAIQHFKDEGLLGADDQRTEKLVVYCKALCAVPMPVASWVMP